MGNYRCSLAGVDLNRVWNDPSKKLHPTIHSTRVFLKQFMEEREVWRCRAWGELTGRPAFVRKLKGRCTFLSQAGAV